MYVNFYIYSHKTAMARTVLLIVAELQFYIVDEKDSRVYLKTPTFFRAM